MAGTPDTPSWLAASKSARRWACGPDRAAIAQSGHQEPSGCAYRCQTTLRHGNSCVAERRGQMESGGSTAPLFPPHGLHQHLGLPYCKPNRGGEGKHLDRAEECWAAPRNQQISSGRGYSSPDVRQQPLQLDERQVAERLRRSQAVRKRSHRVSSWR